ncbi:MAG: calcium-binding protein [Candidatus Accumulibacter sp.]|nr:calcium-binding protein [Accumulibacter sp.]
MAIYNGTKGNDILKGSSGKINDTLNGGLGNDLYRYKLGSGKDVITDTGGRDTLELGNVDDADAWGRVYRSGSDLIFDFGALGRVTVLKQFQAALAIETLSSEWGNQYSIARAGVGTSGDDWIVGTSRAERLVGGSGWDTIFSNGGNDTISGGDGLDHIQAGSGGSTIDCGGGDHDGFQDTVGYNSLSSAVTVNFSGVTQVISGHRLLDGRVLHSNTLAEDKLTNVDKIQGSIHSDVFYAGRSGDFSFAGGPGDDRFHADAGNDHAPDPYDWSEVEFHGGPGNDWFYDDADWDQQSLVSYEGARKAVIVNLSSATITVNGNSVGSMRARDGEGGTDRFVLTRDGNIKIEGSPFGDYLKAGDKVYKWNSSGYTLDGAFGNDTIVGGAQGSHLSGEEGSDSLRGGGGHDDLYGGDGNDLLRGGLGNDRLYGDQGKDVFRFDTQPNAKSNLDTISDFVVRDDTLQLENIVFTALTRVGSLPAGWLRAGEGFTRAADGNDYLIYNESTGALYYDADGSGTRFAPVKFVTLDDDLTLTNLDFVVT